MQGAEEQRWPPACGVSSLPRPRSRLEAGHAPSHTPAALHSQPRDGFCPAWLPCDSSPVPGQVPHKGSPCSSFMGDQNSKFIRWVSSCSSLRDCAFRTCFWIQTSLSCPGRCQPCMYLSNAAKNENPQAHREVTVG